MSRDLWARLGGRPARRIAVAAAVAACLGLAGCTGSPDDAGSATDPTVPEAGEPTTPQTGRPVDGPSPEELAAEILAAGAEAAARQPVGSATGPVGATGDAQLTLEVVRVERLPDATLLELRLATAGADFDIAPQDFASERFGAQNFIRDVYLDADGVDTRYLPLLFEDYREACVCPYLPLEVTSEPQTAYALFPRLPDGVASVTVRLADSEVVVEDVPVSG